MMCLCFCVSVCAYLCVCVFVSACIYKKETDYNVFLTRNILVSSLRLDIISDVYTCNYR